MTPVRTNQIFFKENKIKKIETVSNSCSPKKKESTNLISLPYSSTIKDKK